MPSLPPIHSAVPVSPYRYSSRLSITHGEMGISSTKTLNNGEREISYLLLLSVIISGPHSSRGAGKVLVVFFNLPPLLNILSWSFFSHHFFKMLLSLISWFSCDWCVTGACGVSIRLNSSSTGSSAWTDSIHMHMDRDCAESAEWITQEINYKYRNIKFNSYLFHFLVVLGP